MGRFKSLGSLKSFLSSASQPSGVSTLHFYILNSSGLTVGIGCRLMAAGWQVLFSFLVALRAQKFTIGGPKSLMTVTPLFTDTARNTPFLRILQLDGFKAELGGAKDGGAQVLPWRPDWDRETDWASTTPGVLLYMYMYVCMYMCVCGI